MKETQPKSSSARPRAEKPYVVIRTFSAGVHVGILERREGKEVELSSARRIYQWKGANTLHEVALHGVASGSRVSEVLNRVELTEAIEVLYCSAEGRASLEAAKWL
jgi:hypothetical protein